MKYLIVLLSFFGSCALFAQKTAIIKGTAEGGNGRTIYVYQLPNNEQVLLDSIVVGSDESFKVEIPQPSQDFYRVSFSAQEAVLLFLDSNVKKLELDIQLGGEDGITYDAAGSEASAGIEKWVEGERELQKEANALQIESKADGADQEAIQSKAEDLNFRFTTFRNDFINEYINSPAIHMITRYVDPKKEKELFVKIARASEKSMPGHFFTQQLKAQAGILLEQGEAAPELSYKDTDGEVINLSSLRGKYVLIDFWASWCGPCRRENPSVVKLYNKYKDKGFDIYSVSLDQQKERWVQAIEQDGLVWENHVSDLKGWSSAAAAQYGVRSIPFTVLIDKEGNIIETNLRGAALETKLEELFGF